MVRYAALKSFYEVEKTIGTGGFAKVKLATHLLTGEKVAIKIMDKELLGDDYPRVRMELQALKSISHHHICKLYQVIETPTHFFMVMEYCSGGELFDHIVEKSRLSESEARSFFRQILSAVAYLHKMGYAHRDLKPENILLDKELNLKLIDFGLCANPVGGMSAQLKTSCGSPTYAAPELILGKKYLGSQVDVWSLGVLLYALLCGFLPFDSNSIDSLYKKIMSGKYSEPSWLSEGTKNIINRMLQTNPDSRITVDELLSHPWVTMKCFDPVTFSSLHELHEKDDCVLEMMSDFFGCSMDNVWNHINEWSYDYDTATYQLLLAKKRQNQPFKLIGRTYRLRSGVLKTKMGLSNISSAEPSTPLIIPRGSYSSLIASMDTKQPISFGQEKENNITPARNRKRGFLNSGSEDSPIPNKVTPGTNRFLTKIRSAPSTPEQVAVNSTPTKGKLMCSIEKKINQVRNVLTPRKRNSIKDKPVPPLLTTKNLCNVSTTSFTNPDQVLEELKDALCQKGIFCKTKGFTIRGKIEDYRARGGLGSCRLSFELEVCLVKTSDKGEPFVGVRRKRLKGDAWCYRKVCEEVLKLTNTKILK